MVDEEGRQVLSQPIMVSWLPAPDKEGQTFDAYVAELDGVADRLQEQAQSAGLILDDLGSGWRLVREEGDTALYPPIGTHWSAYLKDETRFQGGLGTLEDSITFSAETLPPDAFAVFARGYIDEVAMGSGVPTDAFTETDGPEIGPHTVWRRAEMPSELLPGTVYAVYVVLFDGPSSLARVTAAAISGTFTQEDVAPFTQVVASRLS